MVGTNIWFTLMYRSIDSESADVTVPLVEISADSVLKTALAGGISCSFSTFLMHPIDTVKVIPHRQVSFLCSDMFDASCKIKL